MSFFHKDLGSVLEAVSSLQEAEVHRFSLIHENGFVERNQILRARLAVRVLKRLKPVERVVILAIIVIGPASDDIERARVVGQAGKGPAQADRRLLPKCFRVGRLKDAVADSPVRATSLLLVPGKIRTSRNLNGPR